VVVQALLILVACPVFISQATVAPDYRALYLSKQDENAVMAQQLSHTNAALALARDQNVTLQAKADDDITAARNRIAILVADKATLTAMHAGAQAHVEALEADLKLALAINENVDARYNKQVAQGAEDRKKINTLMTVARSVDNVLRDTRAKLERADLVNRTLRETNAILEVKIAQQQEIIDKGGRDGKTSIAMIDLVGEITAVNKNIASIDVGSARGVKAGMKMVVHRSGTFLGRLRIEEVNAQESAGVLFNIESMPKKGDKVYAEKGV